MHHVKPSSAAGASKKAFATMAFATRVPAQSTRSTFWPDLVLAAGPDGAAIETKISR
jgi:hypothetical protein